MRTISKNNRSVSGTKEFLYSQFQVTVHSYWEISSLRGSVIVCPFQNREGSGSQSTSIHPEAERAVDLRVHPSIQKQRERWIGGCMLLLSPVFLVYSVQGPTCEMVPPASSVALPTSINTIEIILQRHCQRFTPPVILNCVKFTVKTDLHQRLQGNHFSTLF